MQERYEQAIKETFKFLDSYLYDTRGFLSTSIPEAIEIHMQQLGFEVYCTYNHDYSIVCVYPMQYNLPIHIWRK